MKSFKIKNFVLFTFVIALSFFCINLFPNGVNIEQIESYALFTTSEKEKNQNGANTPLYTPEEAGSIPFSLFTSKCIDAGTPQKYLITDYYPENFVYSTQGEGETAIHNYSMQSDSVPYIMLSSNENDDMLYGTTIFFKFNDQDFKPKNSNQPTISKDAGYLTIEATVNGTQIFVQPDPSNASTDDASVIFSVNLKPLKDKDGNSIPDAVCPDTLDGGKLGDVNKDGKIVNNVSFRTGLYNFKVSYSYQDSYGSVVSNKCVFNFQFYVLDYNSYTEDVAPLTFTNTDTYIYENDDGDEVNSNYEIYNYNYTSAPTVEFDATKFALNFVYTTGYTNYAMLYKNFSYNPGKSPAYVESDGCQNGTETGKVVLGLKDSDLVYTVSTYKQTVAKDYNDDGEITDDEIRIIPYYANFDLADFENFITTNKINTTNQGEYTFNLDFLIQNEINYTVFDNEMFKDLPKSVTNQKLILFGYNLKYYDQNPNSATYKQNIELKNEFTHTNFIAYNTATAGRNIGGDPHINGVDIIENGFLKNIPDYVAITDQAPLRFDYYGNLSWNHQSFHAPFATYDYKTVYEGGVTQEDKILATFDNVISPAQLTEIDNALTLQYIQGSSISNDGIRIMKLIYSINVSIDGKNRSIEGVQYFVFEINNSIQNLYVQAVDFKDSAKQTLNRTYDFKEYTNKDVRVNIEERPNTFFAPLQITYKHYPAPNYDTTGSYNFGILNYKTHNVNVAGTQVTKNYSYNLNGKAYNYLVANNSNNFTFSESGCYKITIQSIVTNIPSTYDFTIDKDKFSGISIANVSLEDDALLGEEIAQTIYQGSSNLIEANMLVTSKPFTLGWNNKRSSAKSFVYFYFMPASDNADLEGTMFKTGTTDFEYFITNGISISTPGGADTDYLNYKEKTDYTAQPLEDNSYFNLDGLYFFYVYDEAGNFFTRTVLIDSSYNTILQGKWQGKEEESVWVNSYDPDKNPANYVNTPTTLYFGDYKALKLPDLSQTQNFTFEDTSFVRAYEYSDDAQEYTLIEKPKISFDFYADVLTKFDSLIKNISSAPIIGQAETGYYLTLENTVVTYEKEFESSQDADGAGVVETVSGNIEEIYKAKIYDQDDPTNYNFNGEAQYYFIVTNTTGNRSQRDICMNFDVIQGTFWAYSTTSGDNTERLIRKNSGTNLDVLKFVYNNLDDETASYYTVKSLTFKHYEFVLDESSLNSSSTSYPFSNKITNQGQLPINKKSADGTQTIVDNINLDASNKTIPGKYILTRTYVGGTHNLNASTGLYEYVGTGGNYYKVTDESGNETYINLFTKDVLVRNYTIYVDRNGIISTEYMIREDNAVVPVREVGDRISITLSQGYEDKWDFKEFFLTSSSTLSLDTNKVPVKINIPLSKYFVYFNSNSNNLYAKEAFAGLEITVAYKANSYTATKYYVIDGYDSGSGMCTCSALKSSTNTLGHLIFNAEGEYTILINDKTGYADTSSADVSARNTNPTTYTYSFEISHISPEAQAKTSVYDHVEKDHIENILTNEYNQYNFATNIKQKNSVDNSIDNNEFIVTWSDPITPYQAKIKQANLTLTFNGQTNTFNVDLQKYTLAELVEIATNSHIINTAGCEYIEYFTINFYDGVSTPKIYDNKEYYRFEYEISLNIAEEYIYQLELSYVSNSQTNQDYLDENGNSFATSVYSLVIDRTKPNTNIDKLLKEESYLTSSNYYSDATLNNFKEENFDASLLENTPSTYTYAFGVSNNFTLTYDETETLPYFFVRKYQKYDSEYASITPDMSLSVYNNDKAYADYTNSDIPTHYPRFKEYDSSEQIAIGNNVWQKIFYQANVPLKTLIANSNIWQNSTTSPNGFFEIIERDLAGNYRNYTVYYNEYESIFLNLQINGYTQKDNTTVLISMGEDAKKDNISANIYFELTEISSKLGWATLTVTNSTTSIPYGEQIFLTPFDSSDYSLISQRLANLNAFMECELNSKFTFSLSKYNATYNQTSLTRHINLSVDGDDEVEAPIIEKVVNPATGKNTYNLILPAYDAKRVIYLEEFSLSLLNADTWQIDPNYTFVGKENVRPKIVDINPGIYKATYSDNFGKSYNHILYIGDEYQYINDFNKEYKFEYSTFFKSTNSYLPSNNNVIYYTGGDVEVTYEANMYKVYLITNFGEEILISGNSSLEKNSSSLQNCKTFKLSKTNLYDNISSTTPVGGIDYFTIKYVDYMVNSYVQKIVNFGIFNALPEIDLTTVYGEQFHPSLREDDVKAAPSIINISWGNLIENQSYLDIDSAIKNVSAILYTKNSKGIYTNGIKISKGQIVSEEGFYKLELKNDVLGNYREVYFAISYSDISLYSITSAEKTLKVSPYEKLDFTVDTAYQSESTQTTNYLLNVIGSALTNNISDEDLPISDKTTLLNQIGFNGTPGICNTTQINHYYYTDTASISYNSNIELNIVEFCFKNNILKYTSIGTTSSEVGGITTNNPMLSNIGTDYYTTIFLLYNLNGPIKIEFFALTRVPKTSQLLDNSVYYKNEKNDTNLTINLTKNPITTTLTNAEIVNSDITLYWNALPTGSVSGWYNRGNVILISDKYGVDTVYDELNCLPIKKDGNTFESTTVKNGFNYLTTTLAGSGLHNLVFKDFAGNQHIFAQTSYSPQNNYSIVLIDKVIYSINYKGKDLNPIEYGVFNDGLDIVINPDYMSYYSQLTFIVTKNGNSYSGYTKNEAETIYSFTEPGKYTVTISAFYGEQKTMLNNVIYNFTIIHSNSARLAYEFVEILGYEVLEVTRNSQNITHVFDDDRDGRVFSLFISPTTTGNGYYTVKLKYGERDDQVLNYSFTINDYIPTISSNVAHGETTTGSIVISYNPSTIYEQLGECYIKILTYNNDSKTYYNYGTITINSESFTTSDAKSFEITRSNSYFIQVETKNGNIISSFRVNRTDPLNTMAIIIIIIAVIAVVVLIIIVVKLRTRMKIK